MAQEVVTVYWCEYGYPTLNTRGFPAEINLPLRSLFDCVTLAQPDHHTCLFFYHQESDQFMELDLDDTVGNWADPDALLVFGPPGLTAEAFIAQEATDALSQSMVGGRAFKLYANTSFRAMTTGFNIMISMNDPYQAVADTVTQKLRAEGEMRNVSGYSLCLFLPGGMPWLATAGEDTYLGEWKKFRPIKLKIYAVFVRLTPEVMGRDLPEVYGIHDDDVNAAINAIGDQSDAASRALALLMMYCRMGGTESQKLLYALERVTGFAPLIVSFDRLIKGLNMRVFDLAIIVASLVPLFRGLMNGQMACEHAIELCGYLVGLFKDEDKVEVSLYEARVDDAEDDMHRFIRAVHPEETDIVLWNGDFGDGESRVIIPRRISLDELHTSYKSSLSHVLENERSTEGVYVPAFFRSSERICLYLARTSPNAILCFDPECSDLQILNLPEQSPGHSREDLVRDVGDLGKELIEQDIILCVDCSKSMSMGLNGKLAKNGIRTRREVASQLMERFFLKSRDFHVRQFVRVITFEKECKRVDNLTRFSTPEELHEAMSRIELEFGTKLYDAVMLATQTLAEEGGSKKRIIVFSDGVDEGSTITQDELFAAVTATNVVVDVICLTTVQSDLDYGLLSLVRATGGVFFTPEKGWDDEQVIREGVSFVEQEAFINLMKRKIHKETRADLQREFNRAARVAGNPEQVSIAVADLEREWRKCHNLEVEEVEIIERFGDKPIASAQRLKREDRTIRATRMLRDAEEISQYPGDDIKVVFCRQRENPCVFAKFYFKLSEGPYGNRWWCLVAKCSPQYPTEPPVFRFGPKIPFHPNVSVDGLVVCRSVTTEYNPVKSLLAQARDVMGLLIRPSALEPVNATWEGMSDDEREREVARSVEDAMDDDQFQRFWTDQRFDK